MLRVNIKNLGNTAILCLRGRIVRGESEPLREAVSSQADVAVVELDLAGVNTIDASGLGLLLDLRERAQASGIEFRIKNVTRLVRQVLEITRLNSVFEISPEPRVPLTNLGVQFAAFHAIALADSRAGSPACKKLLRECRSSGFHPS